MRDIKRVFLIVLDSFGAGELPDAEKFGDAGAYTLKSCYDTGKLNVPCMQSMGLFNIDGINFGNKVAEPIAAYGKMSEISAGKDTTIGHWEISGLVSENPLPVYPDGFPEEFITELSRQTGRKVICNKTYSGTQVIHDYGREHIKTGALIVYTSADSVCQIAAHEDIVPVDELYRYCEMARKIFPVGRIIARPFEGEYPDFKRTANRHDFSLEPSGKTILDALKEKGFDTLSVGKIYDIFAGCGISDMVRTTGNADGMSKTDMCAKTDFRGLCFTNLVDFDMLYGHRRDSEGYTQALNEFDSWLSGFIKTMNDDDILMITADHGCDPGFKGTDHTREYIPFLMYGNKVAPHDLGVRKSFADIASTIADIFDVDYKTKGCSFANQTIK
ncbi:MAG: phosphopentomutase [Oscillospiraceae bacterium]|nr:phosphopentomutase [Oscillospiraceae bacterium]